MLQEEHFPVMIYLKSNGVIEAVTHCSISSAMKNLTVCLSDFTTV